MSTHKPTNGGVDLHQGGKGRATALGIIASMAGLMFGLDTGVISGALPFIAEDFNASNATQGWIVSTMMGGAVVGSFIAGKISLKFGRTGAMLWASILFIVGSLLCALAPNVEVMYVGRVFLGLAVGIAAFSAPLYISEITVESSRGAMISFYQLMVTLGIFLAFVFDGLLSAGGHWRWMLGIMVVPAVIFLLAVYILPQSPRWLMIKGQRDKARNVLYMLRSDDELADAELKEIQTRLEKSHEPGFALFRHNKNFRRSVALGLMLQIMQQLTGINALLYYAPKVFQAAHFGTHAAIWATTLVGLTNMAATGVAIICADRWGRRPLLITSCVIAGLSLLGVAIIMGSGADSVFIESILCGLILVFVAGFAIGAGPLVWTLCSEVQPTSGRDFGIGCSTLMNWAANMAISAIFPVVMSVIGASWTFVVFAACNGLFVLFTLWFVPETKGVTLESIEANLFAGKALRKLGD
ncbi:sugar porter family MFS transporter [Aristophania vespae]|uniref:sugar porter family MFS transporter n=1 Tax=Aristophania vespae TaxID=2697033 RepID=UPI002351C0E0|nr:sugar porter family MFS transporter [Aristophania vespae]UMM63324.1 Galactose-proton symporter [Aristophania vespae]